MPKRKASRYHGVLNIDKPPGMTSHDVVDAVRRILGEARVGHAGTLDPHATGVLLVCAGRATRLAEYLLQGTKEYAGTIRLGVTTDSFDAEGTVLEERDASGITREDLVRALERFIGEIEQKPPAYSAVKLEGVPAYKLARRGKPVDLAPRRVRIEEAELCDWDPPLATVRVRCQAGTYMRSLAHDLGQALGVGAYLASLVRTESGGWTLDRAVRLEEVEAAAREGRLATVLHPPDAALRELPSITLSEDEARRVRQGQILDAHLEVHAPLVSARDPSGKLAAVLVPHSGRRWKPKKVFPPA